MQIRSVLRAWKFFPVTFHSLIFHGIYSNTLGVDDRCDIIAPIINTQQYFSINTDAYLRPKLCDWLDNCQRLNSIESSTRSRARLAVT